MGGWQGHGPFSDLPPWERPGWVYGRGACRYLSLGPNRTSAFPPGRGALWPPAPGFGYELSKEEEIEMLERQLTDFKRALERVEERLQALRE